MDVDPEPFDIRNDCLDLTPLPVSLELRRFSDGIFGRGPIGGRGFSNISELRGRLLLFIDMPLTGGGCLYGAGMPVGT